MRFGIAIAAAVAGIVAASTADAKDKVRIVDSQAQIFANHAIYHAKNEGYFDAENLDVSVIVARGGADAVQAVVTGSQDFVYGPGILSAIAAYAKGAPLTIVANGVRGAREVFWYVRADSPIKSFKDLDGKQLSYSSPGSLTHQVAQTLARDFGIKPKFVSTGNMASTRTQVMSGQVDSAWSAFPAGVELLGSGEARLLVTGHDAPSLRPLTTRVVAVNTDWLAKNRDVAAKTVRALWKAQQSIYANEESIRKAGERFAEQWKLPKEAMARVAEFHKFDEMSFLPVGGLDETLRIAMEYGFIKEPLSDAQKKGLVTVVYDPSR